MSKVVISRCLIFILFLLLAIFSNAINNSKAVEPTTTPTGTPQPTLSPTSTPIPVSCVPEIPDGSCEDPLSNNRPCCNYPGRDRVCVEGYCQDAATLSPTSTPIPVRNPGPSITPTPTPEAAKICGNTEDVTREPAKYAICTTAAVKPCFGDPNNPGIQTAIGCIHTEPAAFIKDLLTFLLAISGGLAFLMMLLGAFQMVTSAGNPESLQGGRDRFQSAIIGLLFVIFAVLFLQIIGAGILNIPGFFEKK